MTVNAFTLLRLSGAGVPPYSARGLRQSYAPIDGAASIRRTINGALKDLSVEEFRKYKSTINGSDIDPPVGVFPGVVLTVDWLAEIAVAGVSTEEPTTEGTEQNFAKPCVPDSIRTEEGFTFYRPRLEMMVTDFNVNRDEYGAATDWSIELEEV